MLRLLTIKSIIKTVKVYEKVETKMFCKIFLIFLIINKYVYIFVFVYVFLPPPTNFLTILPIKGSATYPANVARKGAANGKNLPLCFLPLPRC